MGIRDDSEQDKTIGVAAPEAAFIEGPTSLDRRIIAIPPHQRFQSRLRSHRSPTSVSASLNRVHVSIRRPVGVHFRFLKIFVDRREIFPIDSCTMETFRLIVLIVASNVQR